MNRPQPTEYNGHPRRLAAQGIHQDDQDLIDDMIGLDIPKNRIVTRAPTEPFRLTFIDVTCLVINRTIGTGIFSAPQEVMRGVRSPGIAIVMWFLGCIYGLAGAHVFVEYGLNVPRYVINGVEQAVPRSGGELHYLQYVFSWPRYKKGIVLFSGVVFGISFICVGNMASNCIYCALSLMQAVRPETPKEEFNQGLIYGLAIVMATVTCFIHAFSRRGGILLNNGFAVIKIGILLFIIVSTWVVAGGWSGIRDLNQGTSAPPERAPDSYSGYSQAFLSVVFAYFGIDQPSYVLGEIKHPRKNLPRSMWWGMGIVSVLYLAVNVCFMIIVPASAQLNNNVSEEFFNQIFDSKIRARQTCNAFLAISSFGNIVVWTFTAARMKQEIAKQCFIPFATFFAKNKDVSLGRLLMWLEGGSRGSRGWRIKFLNPANHREKTPVGALILHLVTCIVLIMATYGMSAGEAYVLLTRFFSYVLAAWFGCFLALGILILRFRGPPATEPVQTPNHNHVPNQQPIQKSWKQMTKGTVNSHLSVICSCLYLIGSLYPVIATWIPPKQNVSTSGDWYILPVISWCVLVFSALWFFMFKAIAMYRSHTGSKDFVYVTEPEFEYAEKIQEGSEDGDLLAGEATSRTRRGGLILTREAIYKAWQARETSDLHGPLANKTNGTFTTVQRVLSHNHGAGDELANTDFASHTRADVPYEEAEPRVTRAAQHESVREQQSRPDQVLPHSPRVNDFTGTDFR